MATANATAAVRERAIGGVLFIDEAYALRNEGSSDSAGQECVNTLVKECEEHSKDLVVILAGYEDEMSTFLDANPGFKSRIPFNFYFQDYTCSELETIAGMQSRAPPIPTVATGEGLRPRFI